MFEAVMSALATEMPGSVVLCPAGFYKEYHQHIQKFGLQLKQFDTDIWDNCKIDPNILRHAIRQVRETDSQIAAIGLTIPGNPLIAEYTAAELRQLGEVFITEDVRVVVDASFDKIVPPYAPLGSVVVELEGETHILYNRVMTIGGISKSHMAFGPLKIGVACCGSKRWRDTVKMQATLTFQRETTALAAAVLESTPMSYVQTANQDFAEKLKAANTLIEQANAQRPQPILQIVGEARYGPFLTLSLAPQLLKKAGIERGYELTEMVIMECGIDNVSGDRVGFKLPCFRLNVHCPRISAKKDPSLTPQLLNRLITMADRIQARELTYQSSLAKLPANLYKQFTQYRIACLSIEGWELIKQMPWPKQPEIWSGRQFSRQFPGAGKLMVHAASLRDLAHAVNGVIMTSEDIMTHLDNWLACCKVGCVVLFEESTAIEGLSEQTRDQAERLNIVFATCDNIRTELTEARALGAQLITTQNGQQQSINE